MQYPAVGCDNVKWALFRGKMRRWYKYPPTPLSGHEVMCTAHGPFVARLRYYQMNATMYLEAGERRGVQFNPECPHSRYTPHSSSVAKE